jgi:DedD protein
LSTPFQNRLVGTIVISAVAIIFLPDIFDGEKHTEQSTFDAIPKAPVYQGNKEVKSFPTAQLSQIAEGPISDEKAVDEDTLPSSSLTETVDKSAEKEDTNTIVVTAVNPNPEFAEQTTDNSNRIEIKNADQNKVETSIPENKSWVIQLGSFKHRKNVDALITNLKKNNYVVFTRPIKTHSGILTKVFIGPELSKKALESKLDKLYKLTSMKGTITEFKPAK